MYRIIGSVGKLKNTINEYIELNMEDTKNIICSNVFVFCSELIVNLQNNYTPEKLSLRLSLIKDMLTSNITLEDFITNNGNNTLPTENNYYKIKYSTVRYSDGVRAKYKAIPTNRTIHHTTNILKEHKTDLLLQNPNIDYTKFHKHCLVSVNGFFHYVELDPTEGLFVLNGNRSRQLSNNNTFGIHSFFSIGEINTVPITENMLVKLSNKEFLKDGIVIKLPENISNKSVILILGGYQYTLNSEAVEYLSDNSILVNPEELFLIEKYHESKEYIELSSLPLFKNPRSPSQVSISEMYADENLIKYFTLPEYSFLVIVDAKELSVENIAIRRTHCPDMCIAYEYPQYPIFNGTGKVVNYLSEEDEGQWAIKGIDGKYHNRQYDTVNLRTQKTVGDNRLTQNPVSHSLTYMQKIMYNTFEKY